MKKTVFFLLVLSALLLIASCGNTMADTTFSETTTAATTDDVPVTTTPTTTTAPTTITTPENSEILPPVEAEINAIAETAYWQQVHRMNPITWQRNSDGSVSYVWSLTIEIADGLFPPLGINYSDLPPDRGMDLISSETVSVYIKDMMNDSDYTKYSITPSSWKTARGCDIWFEAEGFVPNYDSFYDMYFVFNLPDDDSETLYPGKQAYIWAEGEPWSCWLPSVAVSSLEARLAESYQCTLISHNQKYSIEHTNGYANGTPPENFPTSPFSFSISTEDGLFNSKEAWQAIYGEGVCAYVMGGIDTEFTRYEIDYMLVEGQGDMWFTLKDFTPVVGETYEIYLFFMAGEGAKHEYQWHYVYANDWIAGAPVTAETDTWKEKVNWISNGTYPEPYDKEKGTYYIVIYVQDIHNVGQANAEKTFADAYGLEYDRFESYGATIPSPIYAEVTKEELETYARFEAVKEIWFGGGIGVPEL